MAKLTALLSWLTAIVLGCLLCPPSAVDALPAQQLFYPFGSQLDRELPQNDDVSSPELPLRTPIAFYENTFSSVFVNDNGLLSFVTEVPSFFNGQFPLNYPIIAPFYGDVDIRDSGRVTFRETEEPDLLARANEDISSFWGRPLEFKARSLFIATWDRVGHYNQSSGPEVNTFQIVIASDGRESFAMFLYPDQSIAWVQGDGKTPNLPDAQAQAGLMAGDGRLYALRGSGTVQVRNYDKMSNTNPRVHGVWLFRLGTVPGGNIEAASERSLVPLQLETCSNTENPCPPTAQCANYNPGFCCSCSSGFIGNGRSCLSNTSPHRLNGRVSGFINDVSLDNIDLHAYISTIEGRTFTALNHVPESLGRDMQLALVVGDVIGWLFAREQPGLPNGFTLTGGLFNRSVEVRFPQTGQQLTINEQYLGLDVFNYPRMRVDIRGSLPSVGSGSSIEIDDYSEEYAMISKNQIRSHSSRTYRLTGNSLDIPFTVDQNIFFESCIFLPYDPRTSSVRLDVSKNYIVHEDEYGIVRFAANYQTSPVSGDDPCRRGDVICGDYATCVVDGGSARCKCNIGYDSVFGENSKEICIDTDECSQGRHRCHQNADCFNTLGSYSCRCKAGFVGDGTYCQQELTCDDIKCDSNGECVRTPNKKPECRCKPGYVGSGYLCQKAEDIEDLGSLDCRTNRELCDENAECLFDEVLAKYACTCKDGYMGPGHYCVQDPDLCIYQCHELAQCRMNQTSSEYNCVCKDGYAGDGFDCLPEQLHIRCSSASDCDRNADCAYDESAADYACRCQEGFTGNGVSCSRPIFSVDCSTANICSPLAECVEQYSRHECQCREGTFGNGTHCQPQNECLVSDNCPLNSICDYDPVELRNKCACKEGYIKDPADAKNCQMDLSAPCNIVNNCHTQASCQFDSVQRQNRCLCKEGYKGDGQRECERIIIPCNILNNCDVRAECLYSVQERGFRCQCQDGYFGDGLTCRPNRPCNEAPGQCDPNAECIQDYTGYSCHCLSGHVGDGLRCEVAPRHGGDYLIFGREMALLKLPLEPSDANPGQLLVGLPRETPVGLDVDCLNGHVYWSDASGHAIRRMAYNGSRRETVFDFNQGAAQGTDEVAIDSPEGLAIDWVSRNIYWVDSARQAIQVARLDNRNRKTVVKDDLENPRGLVVHPGIGRMFWSDWNRKSPKIEWAFMDGSDRNAFLVSELGLPNMLAIDYVTNDLCWTDAGSDGKLECISISGQNRRLIYAEQGHYPFDLTIGGEFIFWTTWKKNNPLGFLSDDMAPTIRRVSRFGGVAQRLKLPLGGNGKLLGIVTVPDQCPRMSNPCAVNNGGCKYICLPSSRGSRTCACPDTGGEGCTDFVAAA